MSSAEVKKRRVGIWFVLLFAVLGLVAGVVSGWLVFRPGQGDQASVAGGDAQQWYTCGMHPTVLQQGPGNCPICGMKLTPRKGDEEERKTDKGPEERRVRYWRAPMDPNYISDTPGKSPMGMDLVPVYAEEGESSSAHTIRIDPITIQNMGIRTAALGRGPLVKTIRTVGRVDYDEELVTFINTKFEGWIEKLHVNQTGQYVRKGDSMFDVYSPQLYSAQEEYLAAVRGMKALSASSDQVREQARRLLEAAGIKLKYLDVSDKQIDELARTKTLQKSLTIYSPAEGIATEKMALEGMYIKPGMKLYTIADLSRVWVYVDIYEYQLPWVRIGQPATMTLPYIPGKEFTGTVVYIYPYLEQRTRVIKVRLEFKNPTGELKPDMYATVMLKADLGREALLIPREAYIDSGARKVAFVDLGGGKFQPREIQVGIEGEEGMVEVLHGLDDGDVVVTSGQFMLDSESKLKEAVAKMMEARRAPVTEEPEADDTGERPHAGHKMPASQPAMPVGTRFACPMEEHSFETDPAKQGPYFSSEPIECPWCGMNLKPLDQLSWTAKYKPSSTMPASAPAEGAVSDDAAYACPMETHPDQTDLAKQGPYFSPEPGECPLCGMALKPLDELPWARVLKAAGAAQVAYTCLDHQHVFSKTSRQCPRCGKDLEPFKVMYTCPDPDHASVVNSSEGRCGHCGKALTPFRGIWLDQSMAEANVPPNTQAAATAAYRCPVHPLVHSDKPGACTICAAPLTKTDVPAPEHVPPAVTGDFLCPMHPAVRSKKPGTCSICAMQLVPATHVKQPTTVPARVQRELDHIAEHYLALHRLLASDNTTDVARHALGVAAAGEEMLKHLENMDIPDRKSIAMSIRELGSNALKINGTRISQDRIQFIQLSRAMTSLLNYVRPDKERWPKLYIFHCPMTKGDWVQSSDDMANPYYGFKMLKCGNLKDTK